MSPPGADDEAVFVGTDDEFTALSAEDGSVRWQVASEPVLGAYAFDRTAVAVTEGSVRGDWRGE